MMNWHIGESFCLSRGIVARGSVLFASKKTPTPRPPTPIKREGEKSRVYIRFDVSLERSMKANSFA